MKVRVAHASLQFSDSDKQHTADIEKIFARCRSRRVAWITGTESGPGSGNTGDELLRLSRAFGYQAFVPSEQRKGAGRATDCWIAVRQDLIKGGWKTGFLPAIPGSQQLYKEQGLDEDLTPRWGPKGLVTVKFDSLPELGEINVGAAHYLTGARNPRNSEEHGVDHWEWNQKLTDVIGEWAIEEGDGTALVFYGGDQNMADRENDQPQGDTFMGEPLTSLWDEMKEWDNTGHGNIDVIASYDKDRRVKGLDIEAYDDRRFSLHTDHFYVEGLFDVEPLKR